MNFALSRKYSEIDFEAVSPAKLSLVGGGCGGGGGSTTVTVSSVQAAAQSAASAAGANSRVGYISFGDPVPTYDVVVRWTSSTAGGGVENGTAWVNTTTGEVSSVVSRTGTTSSGGGFWSTVGSFFGWLFGGSH